MTSKRTESTEEGNKTKVSFKKMAAKVNIGRRSTNVFMSLLKDFKGKEIDKAINEEK